MNKIKKSILFTLALLLGASLVLPASQTFAQADSSAALTINPKKSYQIDAGKSIDDKLYVTNNDKRLPLQLNLQTVDFTYDGSGKGVAKFFLDQNKEPTPWSLKPYLDIEQVGQIDPGKTATIKIHIKIPANLGAGSYYSAIWYGNSAPNGGNVGLSASGMTMVFVNVPGKVNEKLTLKQMGIYNGPTQKRPNGGYDFLNFHMPMNVGYTLKNDGNVTESPTGMITLHPYLFGKDVVIDDVNPAGSLALIGDTRTFTPCIKLAKQDVNFEGAKSQANSCVSPGLWPGVYKISLDLYYGWNGNTTKEITGTAIFWYLPYWFIAVFLVVLAFASYYGFKLYRGIRNLLGGAHPKRSRRK